MVPVLSVRKLLRKFRQFRCHGGGRGSDNTDIQTAENQQTAKEQRQYSFRHKLVQPGIGLFLSFDFNSLYRNLRNNF